MVRRAPLFRAVRKEDDMRAPGCIPEAVRRVLSAVEGRGGLPLCAAACGVEILFPFFHPDENQCLSGFGNQSGRVME